MKCVPRGIGLGVLVMSVSACSLVGAPSGIPSAGAAVPRDVPTSGRDSDATGPRPTSSDAPDFRRDRPPEDPSIDPSSVPDAVPVEEPKARSGNMDTYEVFGRTYHTLKTSEGYQEEGIASWYGEEFHGRSTSSGEPYDMYAMSAAHRSLPLPSYVEVTNLDNGRKVVVRVNDRGPFHDNRLIDVSYAAAVRLGLIATGTARVRLQAVGPPAR